MIAPLRSRHRWMTTLLLVAVPALALLAPAPETADVDSLPQALLSEAEALPLTRLYAAAGVFEEERISVEIYAGKAGDVVALTPRAPLARPDVLVYWSAEPVTERLGEEAVLLGVLGERAAFFPLPAGARQQGGHLVLWSLAHGEVVAGGALPREEAP